MLFDYSVYHVCLLLSCIITALLGLIALQRSVNKGATAFAFLMFGAALFSFCYMFKASSLSIYKAYNWLKVAYVGIASIPVFWYIMVYQFIGVKNELSNIVVGKLFIIPAITLLLVFTNGYHNLYHASLILTRPGLISLIYFEKGPWYWVQLIYSYTLFISGYALLIKEWLYSQKIYRSRLSIFLASAVTPLFTNVLYHMRITPQGIDLSPASYAVAGLILIWGMYRYGIFELIPIARNNVFETIGDGIIVIDLQNRIVDFNLEAENILRDAVDLETGLLFNKVLEGYYDAFSSIMRGLCEQREVEISKGNETMYYNCFLSPVMNKKKNIVGKTLIMRNITDQVKLRERLRTLATLDGLTNIFNRRYFLELGLKELEALESKEQPSAIILFDIDLFKKINDTFGHEVGDKVLCKVVEICTNSLRSADIFARYGGEEFVCLLPNTNSEVAMQIAERIRRNIDSSQLDFPGNSIRITASFGVAGTDLVGKTNLEELIKMADKALYDAKRGGRNCVSLFAEGRN